MSKYASKIFTGFVTLFFLGCGVSPNQSQLLDDINPTYFHECQLTTVGLEEIGKLIGTEVLVNADYLAWGKIVNDKKMIEGNTFVAPYAFQTRCFIEQPSEVTMDFIVLRTAKDEKSGDILQFVKLAKYYITTGKIVLVDATLARAETTIVSGSKDLSVSSENAIAIYTQDRRVISLGATYNRIYDKDFEAHAPMAVEMASASADEKIYLIFRSGLVKQHPEVATDPLQLTVSWDMKIVTFNMTEKKSFVNNIEVTEAQAEVISDDPKSDVDQPADKSTTSDK